MLPIVSSTRSDMYGTNEALEKVFRGVHKHLRNDGLFIFEFWHAAAMLRHYDPVRIRRWKQDDSLILRHFRNDSRLRKAT